MSINVGLVRVSCQFWYLATRANTGLNNCGWMLEKIDPRDDLENLGIAQSTITTKADYMDEVHYLNAYLLRVQAAIRSIEAVKLEQLAHAIDQTVTSNGHVFFLGNGGSATTATHYANDLVMAYARTNRVVRTSSLTDNAALVTGIANDFSFDEVFEYQLRALGQPGDLVVAISASGNSPNLVRGIEYANSIGMRTAAVLGFDGGRLKSMANFVVHVTTNVGDYGPAEDAHLIINHAVAALIRSQGESSAK